MTEKIEKSDKNIEENSNMPYQLTGKQKRYLPVKRAIDIAVAGCASVVLSPVMGILALAIKLDSPGPVLFKQKRVGKDKELFEIWKFRTMRTDTPKDMPTHMLENPDAYITRTGRFMRKYSLDEFPQFWQVVVGTLTLIGPRPALWNQDDLVAERDKYGANSVKPGITGWAQINGRDELEIPVKAHFDGEYIKEFGLGMDIKCFLGTIGSVLCHDGVVEGGTGEMHKEGEKTGDGSEVLVSSEKIDKEVRIGAAVFGGAAVAGISALVAMARHMHRKKGKQTNGKTKMKKHSKTTLLMVAATGIASSVGLYMRSCHKAEKYKNTNLDSSRNNKSKDNVEKEEFQKDVTEVKPKRILITGANSYIGESVEQWLRKEPEKYLVETLDMISDEWRNADFSKFDVVYHVAGIAHADVGKATEEEKKLYYAVNTDLAVETAAKAKAQGVKQFIFMSSMIVYGGCKEKIITQSTEPKPENFYGDSKWQADKRIRSLADETFKVVVLRPPMIYGKGSKGNYPELAKMAAKLPVFPEVKNKRSMLYIDNLCEFVKLMIDNEESGVFFPQNGEYTNTSEMVLMIASVKNHRITMIPGMTALTKVLGHVPGKIGGLTTKAFGDSAYEMSMSDYKNYYRVRSLVESIRLTEENK